jgi:hypothetical protein
MKQISDMKANLLIWLRFEMASRIYLGFQEITKTDFSVNGLTVQKHKEKLKAETSISTMISELKQLN